MLKSFKRFRNYHVFRPIQPFKMPKKLNMALWEVPKIGFLHKYFKKTIEKRCRVR